MIVIDNREHNNKHILKDFEKMGLIEMQDYFWDGLEFGDYINPEGEKSVVIERKKNIEEFAGNCGKNHARFRYELEKAKKSGYKTIIMIEENFEYDLLPLWINKRGKDKIRILKDGTRSVRKAMTGQQMFYIIENWKTKFDIEIKFIDKKESAKFIIETLK